jgi:hypothetical protein
MDGLGFPLDIPRGAVPYPANPSSCLFFAGRTRSKICGPVKSWVAFFMVLLLFRGAVERRDELALAQKAF